MMNISNEAVRQLTPEEFEQEAASAERKPLALSWEVFEREEYPQGDVIAFGVERGEVAQLVSLPNAGKTTLALNAAINLCIGKGFQPIVPGGTPRRVLYVDGETRRARLQRDLKWMAQGFTAEDKRALRQNLSVICEGEVEDESLNLTTTRHLLDFSLDALSAKPDLIVVDTMASLCSVISENDNSEQQRRIWRPMQKLARDCDAAILVIHHTGKRIAEEGQTPERVYRGRGASAAGAFCRAVWLLTPDPTAEGLVTLSNAKIKGVKPKDQRFQLDQGSRWFGVAAALPPRQTTSEVVLGAIAGKGEITTREIIKTLIGQMSERAVKDYLAIGLENGSLVKVRQGVYITAAEYYESAESAESANPQSALPALPARLAFEDGDLGESAEVQKPIGSALSALSRKPKKAKDLRPKGGKARKHSLAQVRTSDVEPSNSAREVFDV